VHGTRDFRHELRRLPNRYQAPTDYIVEAISFDESHAEIVRTVALTNFVNGNNPWMIEFRCGLGFTPKAFQVRAGRQMANTNDLYRDDAVETPLPGAKYDPLAASTDFLQQFVIAKRSRHLRFGRSLFIVRFDIRIHAATKVKSIPTLSLSHRGVQCGSSRLAATIMRIDFAEFQI
jgi:hypothetical protein